MTGILFVAAMSEYDQTLFEDNDTNRVTEALTLFSSIVNNELFPNTTMILFLNKRDLFQQKMEAGVPLRIAFPDYTGDNSYEDGCQYFALQFGKAKVSPEKV